jgi:8-oxo-dGTP diphosphatase
MNVMAIAVALIRDPAGRVLLVRKQGTAAFMQPGGKLDAGEDARTALVRELHEELALRVDADRLRYLGRADAPAANEPGVTVRAEIFALEVDQPITAQAEIAEAVWIDPADPALPMLAPLTREHVLPLAVASQ